MRTMSHTEPDTVTVGVRMSSAERERIRRAAERIGVGLSTFIRMKALEAANGSGEQAP